MLYTNLPNIPNRTTKNRDHGLTIIKDEGMPLRKIESLTSSIEEYSDFVCLSSGASLISDNVRDKIKVYQQANIRPFFEGTVFEIFQARNMVDQYIDFLRETGVNQVEISNVKIQISLDQKLAYIQQFAEAGFAVFSSICNHSLREFSPLSCRHWYHHIEKEINAGAWKVIVQPNTPDNFEQAESTKTDHKFVTAIQNYIDINDIVWEAAHHIQQVWFVKEMGVNVNLCQINVSELSKVEALRLGLHIDTIDKYTVL